MKMVPVLAVLGRPMNLCYPGVACVGRPKAVFANFVAY
jgi:hypothetical protein